MHTKTMTVAHLLKDQAWRCTAEKACAFAPSNIALAKYWGKRDDELNLPMNSSLSISLAHKGATATLSASSQPQHALVMNNQSVDPSSAHARRLQEFLDLLSPPTKTYYHLAIDATIPFAAGLASSACVFAAIVLAFNHYYAWQLPQKALSILARLGSGSAARSIYSGFVRWQAGQHSDGMDSYAEPINTVWPELSIGLCIVDATTKRVSSREGMKRTRDTSPLYAAWPSYADQTVQGLTEAIHQRDFPQLGRIAEQNALTMHATLLSAWPPLNYSTRQTFEQREKVWQLRDAGLSVYFTQDAGPNLKILCLKKDTVLISTVIKNIEWIYPFDTDVKGKNT